MQPFRRNAHKKGVARSAFTLVELLVVIAIVTILIVLSVGGAGFREGSKVAKCLSNMRQLGVAAHLWSGENRNLIPIPKSSVNDTSFQTLIAPYLGLTGTEDEAQIFRCPSDPSVAPRQLRTYRFNESRSYHGDVAFHTPTIKSKRSLLDVKSPANYVMLFDVAYDGKAKLGLWSNDTIKWDKSLDTQDFLPSRVGNYPRPHYKNEAVNLLFYDGSARRASYPLPEAFYHFDY